METEKLGHEPAFASSYDVHTGFDSLGNKEFTRENFIGMSKRFYAACEAMKGILSTQLGVYFIGQELNVGYKKKLIENAYQLADELLKQENE